MKQYTQRECHISVGLGNESILWRDWGCKVFYLSLNEGWSRHYGQIWKEGKHSKFQSEKRKQVYGNIYWASVTGTGKKVGLQLWVRDTVYSCSVIYLYYNCNPTFFPLLCIESPTSYWKGLILEYSTKWINYHGAEIVNISIIYSWEFGWKAVTSYLLKKLKVLNSGCGW